MSIESLLLDIAANTVGNILTWLILGIVTLYIVRHRAQARFENFFGLTHGKKVVVYLSNLWDPKRTTTDKPWGNIVAGQEFQASQAVSRLFGVSPFSLPETVRGFVDAFWIGGKVEVDLTVSPLDNEFDTTNNLIVVGSTQKNMVRRIYARKNALHVIIDAEPIDVTADQIDIYTNPLADRFRIIGGKRAGDVCERGGSFELAIVEKVREKNRVVFFCMGTTGYGSRAAVEYLARNWQGLWNIHRERSFARCLWFPKRDIRSAIPRWEPADWEDVH